MEMGKSLAFQTPRSCEFSCHSFNSEQNSPQALASKEKPPGQVKKVYSILIESRKQYSTAKLFSTARERFPQVD